eukprot:scaffold4.g5007.t1
MEQSSLPSTSLGASELSMEETASPVCSRGKHKRKAAKPNRAPLDEESPEPELKAQQQQKSARRAATGDAGGPVAIKLPKPVDGSKTAKACATCGTRSTPMWRVISGQTYCNACGLRCKRRMGLL